MRLFSYILLNLFVLSAFAQTKLSGSIDGTLAKSSSPYLATASLTVNQGKTLIIEPGVEIYFDGPLNFDLFGFIQARGSKSDPILFTAQDTSVGWRGIQIFKELEGADSNLFEHCQFTYAYQITPDPWRDFGAMLLDTVSNVRISHCLFKSNIAFYGTCIRGFYSKFSLDNSMFEENKAVDYNSTHPTATIGPYASCILGSFTQASVKNCVFQNNESDAPNYPDHLNEARAGGVVTFVGNKVEMSDCLFEGNYSDGGNIMAYSGSYFGNLKLDSFRMERCRFVKNRIRDNYILRLNGQQADYARFLVQDCDFIENECIEARNGTDAVIFCYNDNGGTNDMVINRCRLLNNTTYVGLNIGSGTKVTFSNSEIYGHKGQSIFVHLSTRSNMVNSIVANNWCGLEVAFNAEFDVINSIIAYNGRLSNTTPYPDLSSSTAFQYSYGVFLSDRSKLNCYNSILAHNRAFNGKMANLIGRNRVIFPGKMNNSIFEGGADSTYVQPLAPPWVALDSIPFIELKSIQAKTPTFVRPPKGVGVDYVDTAADFHLVETCDSSLVFNKGLNYILGLPFTLWNGVDFAGNPRIIGNTMDIGIYEISGPKGFTSLDSDWRDTTLCSNNLEAFNPVISGFMVDYTWQKSSDGLAWSNLDKSAYSNNRLINPAAAYYRVIATQDECGVRDTFGPHELSVLAAPEPYLGPDTTLEISDSIWLSPGVFNKYAWNIPGGDTSHALFRAWRYASKGNSKHVFCEVTAPNGCIERDSILLKIKNLNIQPTPALQGIKVYPNPATTELVVDLTNIDTRPITYKVLSSTGAIAFKGEFKTTGLHVLDIHLLQKGLYFLVLESHNQLQNIPILISTR